MQPYQCWDPRLIDRIMNPDALQVESHQFLATHHPMMMYREIATSVSTQQGIRFNEQKFLEEFMKPEDYIFVAILGASGAGKSHLIRWLSAQVPKTANRRVLLIPKFTSLKDVITSILEGMEGETFDKYRANLEGAITKLSPELARRRLADTLGQLIGPNGPLQLRGLTEFEEVFIEELHHLFYDPEYRKNVLLKDGGILHQLTDHLLGVDSKKFERREGRRIFTKEDLPIDIRHFNGASASAKAAYEILLDPEFHAAAIEWINKNLDAAISQMLSFKGTDLVNLLNKVREELAKKDTELVLLIEDFAVMQGIDYDLLDAMQVRPNIMDAQGVITRKLCSLRVALACTSGYFEKLPDTVRTRIEFRVNVDIETVEVEKQMADYVSRYMNAVRLSDNELQGWYKSRVSGDASLEVPSKCTTCALRDDCHSGFGQVNGIGLYPFSSTSIKMMYNRLTDSKNNSKFNPRLLIDRVARHTLSTYGEQIVKSTFPPVALLEYFGGRANKRLSGIQMRELAQQDPIHTARRETLLELWSDTDVIADLHPAIHEAFQIPRLSEEGPPDERETVPPELEVVLPPKPDVGSKLPDKLQSTLNALDLWGNDVKLPQDVAQDMREAIYDLLLDYIPFDDEFLLRTTIRSNLWKPANINFINQYTTARAQTISLELPLPNHDLRDTVIALQAILLFKHFGNWSAPAFEKSHIYMLVFSRLLKDWSNHVLSQLQQLPLAKGGAWDPIPSGVEALAAMAVLSAEPIGQLNGANLLDTLFRKPKAVQTYRSQEWYKLQEKVAPKFEELRKTIIQRIPCTKGSSPSIKIIDSVQVLRVMESMNDNFDMIHVPPAEAVKGYESISQVHGLLRKDIQSAVESEVSRQILWEEKVVRLLGDQPDLIDLTAKVESAVSSARGAAVFAGVFYNEITKALQDVRNVQIVPLLDQVRQLTKATTLTEKIAVLAGIDVHAMYLVENFMTQSSSFLEQSTGRINSLLADIQSNSKAQQLEEAKRKIEQSFDQLIELLDD